MKSKDIFRKSKVNIIVMSLGIVIGCLIVFAGITLMLYKSRLFKSIDEQLLTHRNMVINNPSIIKKKGDKEEVALPPPMSQELISLVWKEGVLMYEGPHAYLGDQLYPVFPEKYKGDIITLISADYTYRAIRFKKDGLSVEFLMNVNSELDSVKQLRAALMAAFFLLIFLALILASYLAAFTLKSIHLAYDKQSFFIQDASHEMRTPLAIIKGQIELLACHTQDTLEEHVEELSYIIKEIRGLEKLNSNLLVLSKEDIIEKIQCTSFSLNHFIREIQEFYLDLAQMQGKYFDVQMTTEEIQVIWDRESVKRCMVILLENAFNYTEADDYIGLIINKKGKTIEINIIDTGMGIKQEEQGRIFDRFFRSREVRSKGIEGSGIGLSLLKSLANTRGIRINFESKYGKGTEFTLIIPEKIKS